MKLLVSSLTLMFMLITVRASAVDTCHANIFTDLPGARIFKASGENSDDMVYRISGNPNSDTVLVFLNGLDKDMTQWNGVLKRLIPRHSDWAFVQTDLLGQGKTIALNPKIEGEIFYQRQIVLLRELMASKGWQNKNLIVIGHSYGGGIAARFAADNPGWVKQNVLIAPFVDNLETQIPGFSGLYWTKHSADLVGMGQSYDKAIEMLGDLAMASSSWTWSPTSRARLPYMQALTHGNRKLNMLWSVSQAGPTITHLIVSMADAMIPNAAHDNVWNQVPPASKGVYKKIPAIHDSVDSDPETVTDALEQTIESGLKQLEGMGPGIR